MVKDIEKNFYIISFSYKSLPLEEREKFIKTGYRNILKNYLKKREIRGYVALETCLRIEVYLETVEKLNTEYLKRDFRTDNIHIYTGREAIKYLLKVICGLDSIIKGEDQILSQLKKAYFESLEEALADGNTIEELEENHFEELIEKLEYNTMVYHLDNGNYLVMSY